MSKIRVIETFRKVCSDCHMQNDRYEGYVTKKYSQMGTLICDDCKQPFNMLFVISLK
jgi:hypothetical protein